MTSSADLDARASLSWPWGFCGAGDFADAIWRAAEVLGNVPGVTWVNVFPAQDADGSPRVHVMVETAEFIRALAGLPADSGDPLAFFEGRDGPSWQGRINGIWLHVAVDWDLRQP